VEFLLRSSQKSIRQQVVCRLGLKELLQMIPAEGAMAIVKKGRPLSSTKTILTFDLITPDAKQ
jgi:hypothetical protein